MRKARALALALALGAMAAACDGGSTPARTTAPAGPTATTGASSPAPPSTSGAPSADPSRVRLELRPVVDGLEQPLLVAAPGDGTGRLFVVEQVGRIRIVRDGELLPRPFLDVSDRIVAGGEQGLLGLAFHPDYASNGRFYVDYTDTAGDTVVAEYRVSSDDPDVADPGSERVLLHVDQPFSNHNGGNLVFGPDGDLYVGMGDGGDAGDPMGNGQSLDTLLGKLLRIDVDGRSDDRPYAIPSDNPFVGRSDARPEIWAFGLRNPWRFSFDRDTGDLWIGDVGQSAFEEVDRVPGGAAGENFGWNVTEGRACYEPSSGCDRSGITGPVAVYGHDLGCSVTGGFVYRGSRFPRLRGVYLFADYCSGTIWGLDAARPGPEPTVMLQSGIAVSSFGQDADGELYVIDHGGAVLQVVDAG